MGDTLDEEVDKALAMYEMKRSTDAEEAGRMAAMLTD